MTPGCEPENPALAGTPSVAVDAVRVCPLCDLDGGRLVGRTPRWRIVLADEPRFPGFTRVIWQAHRREMTDLDAGERRELMDAVWMVESVMRKVLKPDKINLASLGNEVDHLHWHIIARWRDDSHFPRPVWAAPFVDREPRAPVDDERLNAYRDALSASVGSGATGAT